VTGDRFVVTENANFPSNIVAILAITPFGLFVKFVRVSEEDSPHLRSRILLHIRYAHARNVHGDLYVLYSVWENPSKICQNNVSVLFPVEMVSIGKFW